MYYVYILLNKAKTRTYTGVSDDINKRLEDHNTGRVRSSRPYRTYQIIHTESFTTLSEARHKEKFYKSTTRRRRMREMRVHITSYSCHSEPEGRRISDTFTSRQAARKVLLARSFGKKRLRMTINEYCIK